MGCKLCIDHEGESFSTFHFSAVSAALPVALLAFTAAKKSINENQISWQTSSEINSSYFNVERSTDALHFVTAGTVTAAGTGAIKKQYQYVDVYASTVDLYYRLEMIDRDGKARYSKIVKLEAGNSSGITISPNPVINTLTIDGAIDFKQLQIIDGSGKTIRQFAIAASNQYNVSKLQAGVYILRFVGAKDMKMERFVKQ